MVRVTSVGRGLAGAGSGRAARRRAEAVGGQRVEPPRARGVGGVELVGVPRGVDDHVVDQHHPLAPVVERGQLADHGQDGVGVPEVVGGVSGQVLDLADDVVAQVADQAGVERGQVGQVGRVEGGQDGLEGGQRPAGRR